MLSLIYYAKDTAPGQPYLRGRSRLSYTSPYTGDVVGTGFDDKDHPQTPENVVRALRDLANKIEEMPRW